MHEVPPARHETVRYHEALYAGPAAGGGPGWWARPHRLVVDGLGLLLPPGPPGPDGPDGPPVHAYDLGAGSGRHALLLADRLPPSSRVTAVDLLPAALDLLTAAARRAGLSDRVDTTAADVEEYTFPQADAGFVVAFSVLEHVSSPAALRAVLARCRAATVLGGLHVVAVLADRQEVGAHGARPAPVECPLTAGQARDLLRGAYQGWETLREETAATTASETRGGERYTLASTLVAIVARAPGRLRSPSSSRSPGNAS